MIVSQKMVTETEIICQKGLPATAVLDVQYQLCVSNEQNLKVLDVTPPSNPSIFDSLSTDISCLQHLEKQVVAAGGSVPVL